jgi:hypothetical protein
MGDTAAIEWRKTGSEMAIPHRKAPAFRDYLIPDDSYRGVLTKKAGFRAHASIASIEEYPRKLVWAFSVGMIVSSVGLISFLASVWVESDAAKLCSALVLAIGSVTVVFALARGQDLDAKTG